eukprot:3977359-Amphidinium_carterae.1
MGCAVSASHEGQREDESASNGETASDRAPFFSDELKDSARLMAGSSHALSDEWGERAYLMSGARGLMPLLPSTCLLRI